MNDFLYDLYKGISEKIKDVHKEISSLIQEQRITNSLLRAMIKDNTHKYSLPEQPEQLIARSFSLVHDDFSAVRLFVESIASLTGNKVIIPESNEKGNIVALLSNAQAGDYLLINNYFIISSDNLANILLQSFKNKRVDLTVGIGPSATNVTIDINRLNYVIYSDIEALIPPEIINVFPVVNTNK